jgi:hypothetical protein
MNVCNNCGEELNGEWGEGNLTADGLLCDDCYYFHRHQPHSDRKFTVYSTDISPNYLTKRQAAKYVNRSKRWMDERLHLITHRRSNGEVTGDLLFKRSDLDAFMDTLKVSAAPDIKLSTVRNQVNDALVKLSGGNNGLHRP